MQSSNIAMILDQLQNVIELNHFTDTLTRMETFSISSPLLYTYIIQIKVNISYYQNLPAIDLQIQNSSV